MNQSILESQEFKLFLKQFQIPEKYFIIENSLDNIPRFIRKSPNSEISLQKLKESLNCEQVEIVKNIDNLFKIPGSQKIAQCELYKNGQIYGIDFSSACVVIALDPQKNEKIVEICCAPGAKLCMISDLMKENGQFTGQLTGVDISSHRMNTCKSVLKKYGHSQIQLFLEDGCFFGQNNYYDRVLIDAECTHDGSIKHIQKFTSNLNSQLNFNKTGNKNKKIKQNQLQNKYMTQPKKPNEWGLDDFRERFLDQKKLENILILQEKLLRNGFRILKNNGILVYSTCSFSTLQNEEIIENFLKEYENQVILLPPFHNKDIPYKQTRVKNCARFDMETSNSGGMFIAKLMKVVQV